MKKIVILLWLAALTTTIHAQKAQMLFYGIIEEGFIAPTADEVVKRKKQKVQPLELVNVHVYAGGELISTSISKESGFYGILLKSGANYEVVFEKDGYFSRKYEVNCRQLERPTDGSALKCPLDIELYKSIECAELKRMSEKTFGSCSVIRTDIQWNRDFIIKNKTKFLEIAQTLSAQNSN
jgi:hypothetical protein